jgi:hypothetical protein
MAKAQITLPDGTSIKFEGTPEELAVAMDRLRVQATKPPRDPRRGTGKERRKRANPTDLIANLIDGGFFKKPKDLASVKAALEEMGHHYPVTTLSPTMLRQVRNRNLRRLKQDRRWMYTGG